MMKFQAPRNRLAQAWIIALLLLFKPVGNVSARCKVSIDLDGLRTPCRYFRETSGTVEIVPVLGIRDRDAPRFHVSAFPNPFGPGAWTGQDEMQVRLYAPREFCAVLNLYNTRGNRVKTLARRVFPPGEHLIRVDGRGLDNGVYFLVMEAGSLHETIPVVFMK